MLQHRSHLWHFVENYKYTKRDTRFSWQKIMYVTLSRKIIYVRTLHVFTFNLTAEILTDSAIKTYCIARVQKNK